jgi:hypothetical protein
MNLTFLDKYAHTSQSFAHVLNIHKAFNSLVFGAHIYKIKTLLFRFFELCAFFRDFAAMRILNIECNFLYIYRLYARTSDESYNIMVKIEMCIHIYIKNMYLEIRVIMYEHNMRLILSSLLCA